jgi:hypothetical protein
MGVVSGPPSWPKRMGVDGGLRTSISWRLASRSATRFFSRSALATFNAIVLFRVLVRGADRLMACTVPTPQQCQPLILAALLAVPCHQGVIAALVPWET